MTDLKVSDQSIALAAITLLRSNRYVLDQNVNAQVEALYHLWLNNREGDDETTVALAARSER